MVYTSDDVKKLNTSLLLKSMFKLKNATMKEIIDDTLLSQSTVRNILIELEENNSIIKVGSDESSGGRCPNRYSFNKENYNLMMIYIHMNSVDIMITDIFYEVKYERNTKFIREEELIYIIEKLIQDHKVKCLSVAVQGIVRGYTYTTDETGEFTEEDIVKKIESHVSIPVILENDVKAMMIGYESSKENNLDNVAYLFLSHIGMGSAFMINSKVIKGKNNYAGEIGLIPFKGKSINSWLKRELTKEEYVELLSQILITVSSFSDPELIVITGDRSYEIYHKEIMKQCNEYLNKKYHLNVEYRHENFNDAFKGLHHLGVMYLLEEGVKYGK